MIPANIDTPHPSAMNVPVAHVGRSSRLYCHMKKHNTACRSVLSTISTVNANFHIAVGGTLSPVEVCFSPAPLPSPFLQLIFKAVKSPKVRAIVFKGWGGVGAGEVPGNVYLIGSCPHDWLFQRVSCVVHHGGAGTTTSGIALGKPTVVVAFFDDQPFWGQVELCQAKSENAMIGFR